MNKRLKIVISFICVILFGLSPAFALGLKEEGETILVENNYYRVTLSTEGGSIKSLILKPTGDDLTETTGIGNDVEITKGYPGNMREIYRYKTIEKSKDKIIIQFQAEAEGGITYEKRYIFTDKSPLIEVKVKIINKGGHKSFGYRVHNMAKVGEKAEGDTYFCPGFLPAENIQETKEFIFHSGQMQPNNYIKNFTSGWIGVKDKEKKEAILYKVNPKAIDNFYFCFGKEASTIEWWYKFVFLENGGIFRTSYLILPLSGIDSVSQALVKGDSLAGKIDLEHKVIASSLEDKIKDFSKILIVGGKQDLSDYRLYNVERAIKKLPFKMDFAKCRKRWKGSRAYETHYLTNFPFLLKSFMNYGAVILIDIPGWVLPKETQKNLVSYVKEGGSLIFVGDHARGYRDSPLSSIIPLSFDYSREVKGIGGRLMRDKSSWLKGSIKDKTSPITRGISLDIPAIVVHKSKIKKDASLILTADKYPLLAVKEEGKGRVISFPISVSDKVIPGQFLPDVNTGRYDFWDNKLIKWDRYDKLWRNIIFYCMKEMPAVDFSKVTPPERIITCPASVKIDYEITNFSEINQKGILCFTLHKNGKEIKEKRNYGLIPGGSKEEAFQIKIGYPRGEYAYQIEIKDNKKNTFSRIDGSFITLPKTYLEVGLPILKVFGKNSSVDLRIKLFNPNKEKTYQIKTSLIDFRENVVGELPPLKIAAEEIKQNLPIGNLMKGKYQIRVELLEGKTKLDLVKKEIHLASYIDREDFYPISIFHVYDVEDKEGSLENIKKAKEIGFNTAQLGEWTAYKRIAFRGGAEYPDTWTSRVIFYATEEAQKLGMAFCPSAQPPAWTPYHSWRRECHNPVITKEMEDNAIKDMSDYLSIYGKSPRLLATHIADEPSVDIHKWQKCLRCKKAFKEKYGYDMPVDRKDRNYYTAYKFICDRHADNLKEGLSFVRKYDPDFKSYITFMAFRAAVNLNINEMASTLDIPAMFNYGYGQDPYYSDFLWGASNFKNNIWLCADISFGSCPPPYMGTQLYNNLAHNGKGITYCTWNRGQWSLCESEKRVKYAKRAFKEIKEAGPLFIHLTKKRAKAAMLHPFTTYAILPEYKHNYFVSLHRLCRQAFGHIDVLHEEQIKKGKYLSDYRILILPENTFYLPEDVMKEISVWVKQGGTLIVLPKVALYNEYQEKSNTLSMIFGASWGKEEVSSAVSGLTLLPVNGYALIPDGAKVLYRYQNGDPAVTSNKYGKGEVILIGLLLKNKKVLESVTKGIKCWFIKSSDEDIDATIFPDGNNFYMVAVNQVRKDRETKIMIKVPKRNYHIYDLVSGEEISYSYEGNNLIIPLKVESLWGRILAILSERPSKVTIKLNQRSYGKGEKLTYRIRLLRENGKIVDCKLPSTIKVTDSEGRERNEYGGIKVLKGGELSKTFILADNEPGGTWKIEVTEKISKSKTERKFEVK